MYPNKCWYFSLPRHFWGLEVANCMDSVLWHSSLLMTWSALLIGAIVSQAADSLADHLAHLDMVHAAMSIGAMIISIDSCFHLSCHVCLHRQSYHPGFSHICLVKCSASHPPSLWFVSSTILWCSFVCAIITCYPWCLHLVMDMMMISAWLMLWIVARMDHSTS